MSKLNTVAIIGGGVSGLAAGGLLARNGLSVQLFEANDKLGGCAANTNRGGYTFHDGAQFLVLPGVLEHVFERLGLDRASLLPLRKITANQTTMLPDGSVVSFGDGREVTIKRKGEANNEQLQRELGYMLKKWEPVFRLFADDLLRHPFSMSRLFAKGWFQLPKLYGSLASELDKLFSDQAVRAAMAGIMLFSGTPPQKTPVQSILGIVAMLTEGFFLPEGGMGKIPEALSHALTKHGGAICLNSKVEKIIVKNGRVHGVQVAGQGLVQVDAVISTASGMVTFSSLLNEEDVPGGMSKKVQRAPLSHKALTIQLGLSNRVDAASHSNSVLPMMDEQYKVFIPDDGAVRWPVYSVPTMTVPEMAPDGASIIEVFPPIHQEMPVGDWDTQRVERIVERTVQTLAQRHKLEIAVIRTQSPKDFQDRMHLYKGAVYGLSPAAKLDAFFAHKTPISGMFLAGQTTYPGYGVSAAAMSGILAAEALMQSEKQIAAPRI